MILGSSPRWGTNFVLLINTSMDKDTNQTPTFLKRWAAKATYVATILAMVAALFVFDDRYSKEAELQGKLDVLQAAIIKEMRQEVAKNRNAMISNMQRDADDIEFAIKTLEDAGETVPRFQIEKFKQITRDIEELKNNE